MDNKIEIKSTPILESKFLSCIYSDSIGFDFNLVYNSSPTYWAIDCFTENVVFNAELSLKNMWGIPMIANIMKYHLSIIFILLSMISSAQNEWMDTTYHQNQIIATVGVLNKSDSTWTRYSYYENGAIEDVEHYQKDTVTPYGQWQGFLPNGNLIYSYQYKNWELHGFFYEFHPDGSLKLKGQFFNGYKTGIWNEFDDQLNLISSIEYKLSIKDSTNTLTKKEELKQLIIQFPSIQFSYLDVNGNTKIRTSNKEVKIVAYEPKKKKHLLTKPKTN
ncbi:MAG: hypothetical protein MK066_10550 [Crocinitomicaceae bacterium]|nr:hypothetical protein [Crocinitomicaceae bacterium]